MEGSANGVKGAKQNTGVGRGRGGRGGRLRRGGNRHAVCVCAGAGRQPVKSRVKGRLLKARVEDPKTVETRKEI